VAALSAAPRVRRSPHLVLYWRQGRLILHNYASGRRVSGDPLLCRLLDYCGAWRTPDQIRVTLNLGPPAFVAALIRRLIEQGLLERAGRPANAATRAMAAFDPWNPAAGFFHTATKDVRFWSQPVARREARAQASRTPMPASVKRYRGAPRVALPRPRTDGEFAGVLLQRRTWRRFSSRPVTIGELATLLGLTLGVQHWVRTGPRDLPLKTSPSGGARHPVEGYVVVREVEGLKPGTYHYAADRHELERIGRPITATRLAAYYPSSRYFARAGVHVLFTAMFERQMWRYPYPRAYRAALVEAGHVCQTFCLAATWLGLAPFCLMGLADSLIEADLGIDGVGESILYAAGVGRPPKGVQWAPLTTGSMTRRKNPRL
jgi:SagB-type dehydrogenase family enzyme